MGFRENLLKKIEIEQRVDQVLGSIVPSDSSRRIDLETMRQLLEMGPYHHRRERDLDLYCENERTDRQLIIVLDNELKIYDTSVEDVALRKSPTVKEMVNIRNAIKILNDKAVVVSRKADTVQRVRSALIDALDLSFSAADIDALAKDGCDALKNNYAEGVVEILALFAELLGYQKAPKAFQLGHHHIWGVLKKGGPAEVLFGPMVLFSLMRNSVALLEIPISSLDKAGLKRFEQVAKGESKGDFSGEQVFESLKTAVMARGSAR
jgi:hypothetical protein